MKKAIGLKTVVDMLASMKVIYDAAKRKTKS
jgi:hypothetical protein